MSTCNKLKEGVEKRVFFFFFLLPWDACKYFGLNSRACESWYMLTNRLECGISVGANAEYVRPSNGWKTEIFYPLVWFGCCNCSTAYEYERALDCSYAMLFAGSILHDDIIFYAANCKTYVLRLSTMLSARIRKNAHWHHGCSIVHIYRARMNWMPILC